MLTHYFSCSSGAGTDFTKNEPRDVTPNLHFCIRCDLCAHSVFRCVRSVKHRHSIFMLGWARYGSHKKRVGTRYIKLVFLHPVRSVDHVVRSGASGPRNIDALFLMLMWAWCRYHKKHTQTCCVELLFLHPVRSAGNVVRSSASRPRSIDALFFMLGWARCR
jgi:hypothetical protein